MEYTFEGASGGGVPRYLTSIISSPLAWIQEEEVREKIWELASVRLSERSGRSGELKTSDHGFSVLTVLAIPSVTRAFKISTENSKINSEESAISIILHEPSLTGDSLGHKTWAASYLLAKRLRHMQNNIPRLSQSNQESSSDPTLRVLELGSGTGLVGIAFASLYRSHVHLTDLPEIVPNLCRNLEANASGIEAKGSQVLGYALDWANVPSDPARGYSGFDIILAADPLYSPEHPALLVGAVSRLLRKDGLAWVIVEYPVRVAYTAEVEALRVGLSDVGLVLEACGEETGYDDWDNGEKEVECHWWIWTWKGQDTAGIGNSIDAQVDFDEGTRKELA